MPLPFFVLTFEWHLYNGGMSIKLRDDHFLLPFLGETQVDYTKRELEKYMHEVREVGPTEFFCHPGCCMIHSHMQGTRVVYEGCLHVPAHEAIELYNGIRPYCKMTVMENGEGYLIFDDALRGNSVPYSDEGVDRGYGWVPRFFRFKAGCDHEYESEKLGNCYHRYTCKKCGHSYTIDSSG